MLGLIAILVAAGDASLPGAKAMADACSAAVTEGSCVVVPSGAEPGESKAVVTVSWFDGQRQTALILAVSAGKAERERRLVFAPTDPEIERWKAIGFAIATLVGDSPRRPDSGAGGAPGTPPDEDPVVGPPPGKGGPPTSPTPPPSRGLIAATSGFMAGATRGEYVLGLAGRVGVQTESVVEWGVEIAAGLLPTGERSKVAGSLWWFGPLARWHLADRRSLHPVASFAFQIERQIFEAERGPYFGQQKLWQIAGMAGLGLEWPVWRTLSLTGDVAFGVRSGSTIIFVQGKDETDIPRFKANFGLGVAGSF